MSHNGINAGVDESSAGDDFSGLFSFSIVDLLASLLLSLLLLSGIAFWRVITVETAQLKGEKRIRKKIQRFIVIISLRYLCCTLSNRNAWELRETSERNADVVQTMLQLNSKI